MFRRSDTDKNKAADAPELTPPLKPFSAKGAHVPQRPPSKPGLISESLARHNVDRAHAERPRMGGIAPAIGDSRCLTVGRDICLSGEITSCERLIVEGRIDATLPDARRIEVLPTGLFRGRASVDEADIQGRFDGELTVRERLTVRAGAKLSGTIRYATIVIEPGGEVSGDLAMLEPGEGHSDEL